MVRHTLNVSIKSKGYQLAVCFHHLPTEGSTCAYPSEATAFRDLFMHLFCVCVCTTCVQVPMEARRDITSSRTEVTEVVKLM